MAVVVRVPPGRAGRISLRRRLATAERGRDQLDRKLRMLIPEQQRQRMQAEVCRREWDQACRDAQVWVLRAAVLGGQDAIRRATPLEPAEVELSWTVEMGVRYPSAGVIAAAADTSAATTDNAAVAPAVSAARKALAAAVGCAAAEEAVRLIDAEVAVTRGRLRALDKAWLPALRRALWALELTLEQAEQEEAVRLRKAARAVPERPAP